MPIFKKNQSGIIFKTIRHDEYDFHEAFFNELLDPKNSEYRTEKREYGPRKRRTIRLNPKNSCYDIVDTAYQFDIKSQKKKGKNALHSKKEKLECTKHQSTSFADPDNGFIPKFFGWNNDNRNEILVGVCFDPDDLKYWLIKMYDNGTHWRPKDFEKYNEAYAYIETSLKSGVLHTSLNSLAETGKTRPNDYNEVLAGLRWNLKTSKIMVFSNNLESRLLAQVRALDVTLRLKKKYPKEKINVPIAIYPDYKKNYSDADQQKDLAEALQKPELMHYIIALEFINTNEINSNAIIYFSETYDLLKKTKKECAQNFFDQVLEKFKKDDEFKLFIKNPEQLKKLIAAAKDKKTTNQSSEEIELSTIPAAEILHTITEKLKIGRNEDLFNTSIQAYPAVLFELFDLAISQESDQLRKIVLTQLNRKKLLYGSYLHKNDLRIILQLANQPEARYLRDDIATASSDFLFLISVAKKQNLTIELLGVFSQIAFENPHFKLTLQSEISKDIKLLLAAYELMKSSNITEFREIILDEFWQPDKESWVVYLQYSLKLNYLYDLLQLANEPKSIFLRQAFLSIPADTLIEIIIDANNHLLTREILSCVLNKAYNESSDNELFNLQRDNIKLFLHLAHLTKPFDVCLLKSSISFFANLFSKDEWLIYLGNLSISHDEFRYFLDLVATSDSDKMRLAFAELLTKCTVDGKKYIISPVLEDPDLRKALINTVFKIINSEKTGSAELAVALAELIRSTGLLSHLLYSGGASLISCLQYASLQTAASKSLRQAILEESYSLIDRFALRHSDLFSALLSQELLLKDPKDLACKTIKEIISRYSNHKEKSLQAVLQKLVEKLPANDFVVFLKSLQFHFTVTEYSSIDSQGNVSYYERSVYPQEIIMDIAKKINCDSLDKLKIILIANISAYLYSCGFTTDATKNRSSFLYTLSFQDKKMQFIKVTNAKNLIQATIEGDIKSIKSAVEKSHNMNNELQSEKKFGQTSSKYAKCLITCLHKIDLFEHQPGSNAGEMESRRMSP